MRKTFIVALSALALAGVGHAFAGNATSTSSGIVIKNGHGAIASPVHPVLPPTPAETLANATRAYQDAWQAYVASITNARKYEVNGRQPNPWDPSYKSWRQAYQVEIETLKATTRADAALKKAQNPPSPGDAAHQAASTAAHQDAHNTAVAIAKPKGGAAHQNQ